MKRGRDGGGGRILENPVAGVLHVVHRAARTLRGSVSCGTGSGWSEPCVSIQLIPAAVEL